MKIDPLPETSIDVYALSILVATSVVLETFIDVLQSKFSSCKKQRKNDNGMPDLTAEAITRESLPTDAVI